MKNNRWMGIAFVLIISVISINFMGCSKDKVNNSEEDIIEETTVAQVEEGTKREEPKKVEEIQENASDKIIERIEASEIVEISEGNTYEGYHDYSSYDDSRVNNLEANVSGETKKRVKQTGRDDFMFESIEDLYEFLGLRINDRGNYYTDNTDYVKSTGFPVADSMDEFYGIIENAARSKSDSVSIFMNLYDIDVNSNRLAYELEESEAFAADGSKRMIENRYVIDERPFADFERVVNNTGVQVMWNPGYQQSIHFDVKYVLFDVKLIYIADKIHFSYSNYDMTRQINDAIANGEKRFTICRYFKNESPDEVEYNSDARNYLFGLAQAETEQYYNGYHVFNIAYDNKEMVALSNDGVYSGMINWEDIHFSYCNQGYEGYENFGCVYYKTIDVSNVRKDLAEKEGLVEITSIEQLTQIRNSKDYSKGCYWLGYFRGTQDEAFQIHNQMVMDGNPVAYERITDDWWYFYWG